MKKIIILVEIIVIVILLAFTLDADPLFVFMRVTAYCPCEICCGIHADGFTAMGDKAQVGCIAIDPRGKLRMGWTVYVPGYGFGKCNDTGSAIKGDRIDVCFNEGEHQKALDWGVRYLPVWVIKK